MNNTVQLKNNLISRIQDSKDLNFLRALQVIFDSSEQSLFELNEQQEKSIQSGRLQIKNGEFKEHEEVISELEEWLKKE